MTNLISLSYNDNINLILRGYFMTIPITQSMCKAATGAVISDNNILTVNSADCAVENSYNGTCIETARAYEFVSGYNDMYLATGTSCNNRVYILNSSFKEIASICFPACNGPILSAYAMPCNRILLTYRNKITVGNYNGNFTQTVDEICDSDSEFISAVPTDNGILFAYTNGSYETLQYNRCCGYTDSCILPSNIRIKNFVTDSDTVYGLFSKGYPYRYLLPVVQGCSLLCPNENDFSISDCNCV